METMQIRSAAVSDIAAIQRLCYESYRDHFAQLWTADGIQRFLDKDFATDVLRTTLTTPSKHLWLTAKEANEANDRLVGYAKINWSVPDPIDGIEGAELQKIYFRKSAAGKGYGAALLERALDCVKERSCCRVWLEVLKVNVGAQKFYARMGFRIAGEIPFRTDLAEIGMVVMVRDIE
jgi:ribosomal protein S18 acetylase RimI-like enzyme